MSKGKIIRWIAISVSVLVVAVVLIALLALDAVVRSRIEASATESLKTPTRLQSAKLSLLNGTLNLKGLVIESPQGFGSDILFGMAGAKTDVTYGELRGDPIKIDQVVITKPSLVIEYSFSDRKLNLQVLTENLRGAPTDSSKEPTHLIIKSLRIEEPEVSLWPGVPGLAKTDEVILKLPTIELHDIGSGPDAKNGAAIKDVVMRVIAAMAATAADSDKLPPAVRALLALNADNLGQAIGDEFEKQIRGLSKSVQDNLGEKIGGKLEKDLGKDAGKAVEGGLKDLAGSLQKQGSPTTRPGK